jgi:DNA polymerase-3 subunit epsilon
VVAHEDLDKMASLLNASGRYRVLRRLDARPLIVPPAGAETRLGLFLDCETTGLDPSRDEIIELAMVPFTYSLDGQIFEIHEPFQGLREPEKQIPVAITALTGITDEMVAGQKIDPVEVASFVSPAALVIAHNAAFDRPFVERLSDVFITKPWACSMTQIDWAAEGYEGTKLSYLCMETGFFYDRHRAKNDCIAAIELLATPLRKTCVAAMTKLLERARRPSCRLWAVNSPFEMKDVLKARGYRWNGDASAYPRAWYIDVDDTVVEHELAYLRTEIYHSEVDLPVRRMTAYERFSDRS